MGSLSRPSPWAKGHQPGDLATDQPDRLAMILGSGGGLCWRAAHGADLVVRIPMAGEADSLNMAATSALASWTLRSLLTVSGQGSDRFQT
jgi:tRNA G18 (ribose-2'-O)-methylase SpoU